MFIKLSNHPNIIIGGDFNQGDIDWNREVPNANNPATTSQHNEFLQLMDDFSLTQHFKTVTRPASEKILDLLLSTYPNSISHVSSSTGLSDHLNVYFEINLKATRFSKPPHRAYLYEKANFVGLNEFIAKSSAEFFASNPLKNSVEQNWNALKNAIIQGISLFVPQKMSKPKYKLPWVTPNIKRDE